MVHVTGGFPSLTWRSAGRHLATWLSADLAGGDLDGGNGQIGRITTQACVYMYNMVS